MSQPDSAASLPLEETSSVKLFKAEVEAWAKRIGVEPKEIYIRMMKNKTPTCSSKGRLTFNTDLIREPSSFRLEVIVHELFHLKIPNHGSVFKELLRAHLAEYSDNGSM